MIKVTASPGGFSCCQLEVKLTATCVTKKFSLKHLKILHSWPKVGVNWTSYVQVLPSVLELAAEPRKA